MKQYKIYLIKTKTLEKIYKATFMADSLDEARKVGEVRYLVNGYFIAVERLIETI